jgi:hypothetical protein
MFSAWFTFLEFRFQLLRIEPGLFYAVFEAEIDIKPTRKKTHPIPNRRD